MAEPSRGFKSLRKKRTERPKISAPTLQAPTPRQRSEDREKLQRRMSQRLMVPIGFEDAPPMPSLPPQMGMQQQGPGQKPPSRGSGGRPRVDPAMFEAADLDAEAYVNSLLANASLEEIDQYENELMKIKNRASADLQQNVYKNIDAFIKVSQHVKTTKSEMDKLRNLITELRVTIAQSNAALGIDVEDSATTASRKYANRSSIANLEAIWSSQLQELWKRVDGSQKFLPAIPGRHVIHESGKWIELNSATWKPRRRVHLILLNDHFLAASEKKRVDASQSPQVAEEQAAKPSAGSTQLVADHCFPLNDVEVTDFREKTGASASMTKFMVQAVIVRNGSESLTYAAVDSDRAGSEKTAFVGKIRKAVANMRKALLLDAAESNPVLRPTSSSGPILGSRSAPSTAASAGSGKADMLNVDVDGKQESIRWVEGQIYELEIDVALQRFEQAVKRVEKLRSVAKNNKSNPAVQALVGTRAQQHVDKLVEWLTHYLQLDQKARTKIIKYSAWLIRLDLEQLASQTYLEARSDWIRYLIDKVLYEGDIKGYMYQISYLYFNSIKHTISNHSAAFSQQMSSACIAWAQERVREFNTHQVMHLKCNDVSEEQKQECLAQSRKHADFLQDVSVDFAWLVGQGV